MQESSAVSFINGTVTIGDKVSIYVGNNGVLNVVRGNNQPSLALGDGAKLSVGISSNCQVKDGKLSVGASGSLTMDGIGSYLQVKDGKLNVGESGSLTMDGIGSHLQVGPGNFKVGPSSGVKMGSQSTVVVTGKYQEDNLILHGNAKFVLAPASMFTVGNNIL